MTALLDPKIDLVFKQLFVRDSHSLVDLINSILQSALPISTLQILNPQVDPKELTGKFIVLDILAKDVQGTHYNIEMQVRRQPNWSLRSLYYLVRTLSSQLQRGQDYRQLKPLIGIHLLDFELFTGTPQFHWEFQMRDHQQPHIVLDQALQLHLIELPKADRLAPAPGSSPSPLADWITYFKHWQEHRIMSNIQHPPVKRAMNYLCELSADEETRRLAEVRERALFNEYLQMSGARQEGIEIGLEQGRKQGVFEGQAHVLKQLLAIKFGPLDEDRVLRIEQASPSELNRWSERILSAETAESLFSE